jgi:hypothetical protein
MAQILLILQGCGNIAQGIYAILYPFNFPKLGDPEFAGTSNVAIQSIGTTFYCQLLGVVD